MPSPSSESAIDPAIAAPPREFRPLNTTEQALLLQWARQSLNTLIRGEPPPDPDADAVPERLQEKQSCFVTLSRQHALRGCVGNVLPRLPLHLAVIENARSAATRDPRFSPVQADELPELSIEISVLTEPQRLYYSSPDELLALLQPHLDGVLLQIDGRLCTFLPQVWAQIPDKEDFLNRLAEKGGFPPDTWRGDNVCVFTYRVQVLDEPSPPAGTN